MAIIESNQYDDPRLRAEIKLVFGNRKNWNLFCQISREMMGELLLQKAGR